MPGAVKMLVAGRYLLTEPIGHGGAGRIWRASDQLLDREVAVKEIPLPLGAGHADLLAAATSAARAAARLDHPGVMTVLDVVEQDGLPWVVMRFVDGPSLTGQGQMAWQRAARVGGQVAAALEYAHAAGLVHGDLKPGNVLLTGTDDDRVIVTDFGITRALDTAAQPAGTPLRFGTAGYLAPEQLDDGQVGPPADLWALGVLLYQLTEGAPPFTGSSTTAVISAILTGRRKPPQHAGPLAGLIESLLSADPAVRPDADAARAELSAAGTGRPAAAAPAVTGETAPPRHAPAAAATPAARAGAGLRTRLAAAVRANPRFAIGVITGVVMILALLLVTTVFSPTAHRPGTPGTPGNYPYPASRGSYTGP